MRNLIGKSLALFLAVSPMVGCARLEAYRKASAIRYVVDGKVEPVSKKAVDLHMKYPNGQFQSRWGKGIVAIYDWEEGEKQPLCESDSEYSLKGDTLRIDYCDDQEIRVWHIDWVATGEDGVLIYKIAWEAKSGEPKDLSGLKLNK